jgi:hypothetical protein
MEFKELSEENKENNTPKNSELSQIQKIRNVVKAWKLIHDLPVEGDESRAWDVVHFSRYAKAAKSLILLFGYEGAVQCMEFMSDYYNERGLSYKIETIVRNSDLFREKLSKKGIR